MKEKGAGADDEDRVEFEPLLVLLPDGIFGGVERGVFCVARWRTISRYYRVRAAIYGRIKAFFLSPVFSCLMSKLSNQLSRTYGGMLSLIVE